MGLNRSIMDTLISICRPHSSTVFWASWNSSPWASEFKGPICTLDRHNCLGKKPNLFTFLGLGPVGFVNLSPTYLNATMPVTRLRWPHPKISDSNSKSLSREEEKYIQNFWISRSRHLTAKTMKVDRRSKGPALCTGYLSRPRRDLDVKDIITISICEFQLTQH